MVVYLTAGAEQDLTDQPVTDETKAMKMPGLQPSVPGGRAQRYDCVKAGPHGPWRWVKVARN